MSPDRPGARRRHWAAGARQLVAPVTGAAVGLAAAFRAGTPLGAGDPARDLLLACADLTRWLASAPAPRACSVASAEAASAAGVLRNAAYAFRNASRADDDRRPSLRDACEALLAQGFHHLDAFARAATALVD